MKILLKMCVLCTLLSHNNAHDKQLQGRDKCITDLIEKLNDFQMKLILFSSDLISRKLLHFLKLHELIASTSVKVTLNITNFLTVPKNNFDKQFQDFNLVCQETILHFSRRFFYFM
jgi:hypothetical protein